MKKILLILFLSFASLTSAAEDMFCRPTCKCEKMKAYYPIQCPMNYIMEFSYMLFNPFEDGLVYAETYYGGKPKDRIAFNSGGRASFYFPVSRNKYEEKYIDFLWTYINLHKKNSTNAESEYLLLFLPPNFLNGSNATASLSGNLNTVDFGISKSYLVSRCFEAKPFLGIKGAYIDQEYKIDYTILRTINKIKAKNDYWGVGIETGYNANFIVKSYFSIYAQTNLAILFGRTSIKESSDTPVTSLAQYNLKEKSYNVLPYSDISFGLSWNRRFSKQNITPTCNIGYEFQHWWNQNQLKRFMDTNTGAIKTVSRGNLKFAGFVITLKFEM
jgi:Legionella pneumophila major outer membrane protein precursor